MCTAERATFQTKAYFTAPFRRRNPRYVLPHSRVMKNKREKLIFWNEAVISSQAKVIRTVSRRLAITLLWPYQPVCIYYLILSCRLWTANHDELVFGEIVVFAYVRNSEYLLKTGCCSHHIALLYFIKVLPANWRLTLGAFPLPFKLRKLKLRIENTPNGNAAVSQKLPYISQKSFYARMRWFFRQCEKGIIAKLQWKLFLAFTGHMVYLKCHMIILQCSYYNLQETLHTWSLSNIRGFPCHLMLRIIYTAHVCGAVRFWYGHWSWLRPL